MDHMRYLINPISNAKKGTLNQPTVLASLAGRCGTKPIQLFEDMTTDIEME
jgi:hypothetical protein